MARTNAAQRALRRDQALDLRNHGASFRQIAKALGISVGQAFKDVEIGLRDMAERRLKQGGERLLQEALSRHQTIYRRSMQAATVKGVSASGMAKLFQAALAAQTRIERLLGLEAAHKFEIDAADLQLEVTFVGPDGDAIATIDDLLDGKTEIVQLAQGNGDAPLGLPPGENGDDPDGR